MPLSFEVLARDGAARRGRLRTPHGVVETPAFMPVGTLGAVKGLTPAQLDGLGAEVMLSNLYHLALRPGVDAIEDLGGLHAFTGWDRPILTDSGGYQVFSLADLRTIDADGVTFRSHLDGATLRFTPASVVSMQRQLGVDIAMMLDECPPWPVSREDAAEALERTLRWAEAAREEWERRPGPGGLFAILQGSSYLDLRRHALDTLVPMGFEGYAIGGVSVGEPDEARRKVIEAVAPALPEDRPRYLMGVGTPEDMVRSVAAGVDLFDCVLPARNARHGNLFTRSGVVKIKNARYRHDPRPIDPEDPVPGGPSRAFVHHLIRAGDLTGKVLATLHNLRFYLDFMARVRKATESGTLSGLLESVRAPNTSD